jgi:hypothetical protein
VDLSSKGTLVFRSAQPGPCQVAPDAAYEALVRIPANLLAETNYVVGVLVTLIRGEGEVHALAVKKALTFLVYDETNPELTAPRQAGVIAPVLEWSLEEKPIAVRA